MTWVGRELVVASALGALSGAALMLDSVANAAGLILGAVVGAIVGLVVGSLAVCGGSFAMKTTLHWQPRSRGSFRHRFAFWSMIPVVGAWAVFLIWGGAASSSVADPSTPNYVLPLSIIGAVGAVSYVAAYILAPTHQDVAHLDATTDN
jgi:hypothetical protein